MNASGPAPAPTGGVPDAPPAPFDPYQLGPVRLRNRIVKAATFEGVMPRGAVTNELIDFHRRVAAGGAALSTVTYCAVSTGGRVNRHSLVMRPELTADLERLTDTVHDEGAAIAAQLGHGGLVANARSNGTPTLAPSTRWSSPGMGIVKAATEAQLDEVVAEFGAAATVAENAGFDVLEVHLGHNYLPSSFLSPNLNKRNDRYGGILENRLRFPRRIIDAVRSAVDDRVAVVAKFNMADGVEKGLWLEGRSSSRRCSRRTASSTPSSSPGAARYSTACTSSAVTCR